MSDLLYRVLLKNELELNNDIIRHLKNSTSPHYMDLDWEDLMHRVESLVAHFLMSLRETPDLFVNYVTGMAIKRISEGFAVEEVLMSLRVLEEKVWIMTVEGVPREGQISSLSRVTGTIGAAKDRLAVVYVDAASMHDEATRVAESPAVT